MYQAWGKLEEAVRTGGAAFDAAYGSDLWEFYSNDPEAAETFDRSMSNLTTIHLAPGSAGGEFDFSFGGTAATVCDIGGGQGRLLAKLLSRYPSMSGVLFDQQAVVEAVSRGGFLTDKGLLAGTTTSPPAGQVGLVGGSFFEEGAIPTAATSSR